MSINRRDTTGLQRGTTFIGPAGYENLRLDIKLSMQKRAKMGLNGFAKPYATFRVGVVVCSDCVQCAVGCIPNPLRRGKVHVALTKVDAIRG